MVAGSNKVIPGYRSVVVGRYAQRPIYPGMLQEAGQPHLCIVDGKKFELYIYTYRQYRMVQTFDKEKL